VLFSRFCKDTLSLLLIEFNNPAMACGVLFFCINKKGVQLYILAIIVPQEYAGHLEVTR
jgi:hypothetical protein